MTFLDHTSKNGYKQQLINEDKPRHTIAGKLKKTSRKQFVLTSSRNGREKPVYKDQEEKEFVNFNGYWWKFPEQIEY